MNTELGEKDRALTEPPAVTGPGLRRGDSLSSAHNHPRRISRRFCRSIAISSPRQIITVMIADPP
jgi:hypothetical protein